MGKKLLRLVWNLPASFSLPSASACRRALARIPPAAIVATQPAGDDDRRRHPRWFYA
jgi:hypothetical protein